MDKVADRLAAELEDALSDMNGVRSRGSLTDEEAAVALGSLLEAQGIRLNDGLLHTLAARPHRSSST